MDQERWAQNRSALERLEVHDQALPEDAKFHRVREFRTEVLLDLEALLPLWERSESVLPEQLNRMVDGFLSGFASVAQDQFREANSLLANVPRSDSRFEELRRGVEAESSRQLREMATDRARIYALLHAAASSDALGVGSGESSRRIQEMREITAEARNVLADLKSKDGQLANAIGDKERKVAADTYEKRAASHHNWEWSYFVAFLVSGFALAAFAKVAYGRPVPASSQSVFLLAYVTHGLLLIVPPAVLVQITLRRWSIERNLRLLYEHRVAAVDQFERIIKSIPAEMAEQRAQLRVDFARLVLADPITGYLENSTSQLNYGPAVKLAEKSAGP